jgi:prophage regulatory protein
MKLLGINELKVLKGIPFSKGHLWRLIKSGRFVKPIKVGQHRIAFVESEIDEWLEAKAAERDLAPTV